MVIMISRSSAYTLLDPFNITYFAFECLFSQGSGMWLSH